MAPTGGGPTQAVTFQSVKISDGTITDVKTTEGTTQELSDSISADVLGNDGKIVGELKGTVTKNKIHGKTDKDPATVVDAKDKQIGTVADAQVAVGPEGAHVVANPKHIPKESQLAKDLEKTPGHMDWLGMDLAKRPSQGQGPELIGMYLLVALTVVTGYYQQRQMTARTPASAQNQQMQMMGKIFPLFFGFISLQVPAGVVLYFVVSNLWQIGQQAIIFRQQDAADAAAKAAGGGKGGGTAVGTKDGPASKDAKVIEAKPAAPAPAKAQSGKAQSSKAQSGNPQGSAKGGSNPSNRSRRRRRRRKGR
jgi:hypothetical protein